MTLRARLTLAFVGLLVLASGVLGVVVVRASRATAVDQIDEQLRELANRRPGFLQGPLGEGPRADIQAVDEDDEDAAYRDVAEMLISSTGAVVVASPAGFPGDPEPLPDADGVFAAAAPPPGRISTISADDGSLDYRVLSVRVAEGGVLGFAVSLADVEAASRRLVWIVVLTTAGIVVVGAAGAWLFVRREFQPVDRMVETAQAIGAGDLSQRVDHPSDRTELGRLAGALDEMVGRLQEAFAVRAASEARLKRFVGDASHELRTPITAVRGYAELYRAGGVQPGEPLDRAMERIEREAARMGRLVDDLLVLARLDQQRPLQVGPVELTRLAGDAVHDERVIDPSRPVSLDAAGPVVVAGDEARLRQVVGNLLANARTHTPPGTPVHVTVTADGAAGDGVARMVVRDEGPGIPAEHLASVFERFYRADPSRARDTGGSGLGLSIVAAVVAAHGGSVDVRSEVGEGATFTVTLPLAPTGGPAPDSSPDTPAAPAAPA